MVLIAMQMMLLMFVWYSMDSSDKYSFLSGLQMHWLWLVGWLVDW
jgi:hypothetical protein